MIFSSTKMNINSEAVPPGQLLHLFLSLNSAPRFARFSN